MSFRLQRNVRELYPITTMWIDRWVASYKPVSRKGIPRGQPLPISKERHTAAAWMVLDLKLKIIAELAGVNYGSLRVWRTEDRFRKLWSEACQDYINYLFAIATETAQEDPWYASRRLYQEIAREADSWSKMVWPALTREAGLRVDSLPEVPTIEDRLVYHHSMVFIHEMVRKLSEGEEESTDDSTLEGGDFFKNINEGTVRLVKNLVQGYKELEASGFPKAQEKTQQEFLKTFKHYFVNSVETENRATLKVIFVHLLEAFKLYEKTRGNA